MIEFDVDMGYLLEEGELDCVILNDENGEHEPMEFVPKLGSWTCRITASSTDGLCSDNPRQRFELSCGHSFTVDGLDAPVACPVCGKAVER